MLIVPVARAGADDVAAYLILPVLELEKIGAFRLALHEPLARELRNKLCKAYIRARAGQAAYGEEHFVSPDDARIIQPENDDGQGEIKKRVILCRLRIVGNGLYIRKQRLSSARARYHRVDYKPEDDYALGRGEIEVFQQQRRHREYDEEKHERSCIRFKQSLRIFHFRLPMAILIDIKL